MNPNENINVTLKGKLKKEFVRWCQFSTINGLSHIARSNSWFTRTLWILLFLLSFSLCLFTIIQSLIAYENHAVSVTFKRVQELPAIFPAVTICNINPFNEIRLQSSKVEKIYFFLNEESFNTRNTNAAFENFTNRVKRVIANDKSLSDRDRFELGFRLDDDMLVSCEYNGIFCSEKDFFRFWSNEYGNCYTFNAGTTKPLKTSTTGDKHGKNSCFYLF